MSKADKITPLSEVREIFDLYPQPLCSRVSYLKRQDLDFEVYLPSRGMNLQRDLVWSLEQKRELIWSVIIKRHVPACSMINVVNKADLHKEILLVIDGKQRLTTIFDFIDDKFSIIINDTEFLFSELTDEYQNAINYFTINYNVVNEMWEQPTTDEQKIAWFNFINFAGTPQDKEHMGKLAKINRLHK